MEAPFSQLMPIELDKKAYRFFPTKQQAKSADGKKGTRYYFYGQIEHDEYQKRKLGEFHHYAKQKNIKYDEKYFNDQRVLLFLSGNKYKPKNTLKAMATHAKFQTDFLPIPFEKVQKIITKGYMYPCGRDKYFRPIVVYNAPLIDFKDFELSLNATVFALEEVKAKMFIPGQVECWNFIYDLGGLGISEIPTSTLKSVLEKISLNYGGRLFKLWIVNAPSSITMSWKIASAFMDDVTVNKIKISKKNTEKSIFDLCHPSQVEEKYGGTQKNRTQFWPYRIPEGVFDEKRLINDEQYKKLLLSDKLTRNHIDPKFSDMAKGHVTDLTQEIKVVGQMGDLKLQDDNSEDDDKEQQEKEPKKK